METIFGAERASLKKAISQGGEIEKTLERLFALNAIRPTSDSTIRATRRHTGSTGGQRRRSRARCGPRTSAATRRATGGPRNLRWDPRRAVPASARSVVGAGAPRVAAASPARAAAAPTPVPRGGPGPGGPEGRTLLLCPRRRAGRWAASVVVAGGRVAGERSFLGRVRQRAAGRATATLEIQSRPAGRHIFVDGSPSGLRTPAGLPTGLSAGAGSQVGPRQDRVRARPDHRAGEASARRDSDGRHGSGP